MADTCVMSPEPSALGEVKRDRDGFIRCRVCGCTEREPCNPPCAWHFPDLCDSCALLVTQILVWWEGAHRPSWARLKREVEILQQAFKEYKASEETFDENFPGGVAEFRRLQEKSGGAS